MKLEKGKLAGGDCRSFYVLCLYLACVVGGLTRKMIFSFAFHWDELFGVPRCFDILERCLVGAVLRCSVCAEPSVKSSTLSIPTKRSENICKTVVLD